MTDTIDNHSRDTTRSPSTIGGMTCASCAARIGKRLNKIDGVEAGVNYATEQATSPSADGITVDELDRPGRSDRLHGQRAARRPTPARTAPTTPRGRPEDAAPRAAHRLIGSTVLAVPVLAAVDDHHAAVHQLAVADLRAGLARSCCGVPGRSIEPHG